MRNKRTFHHYLLAAGLVSLLVGCSNDEALEESPPVSEDSVNETETSEDVESESEQFSEPSENEGGEEAAGDSSNEESETVTEDSQEQNEFTVEDTATADQQLTAEDLTKEYLRGRNELVEDANHFVQYDGTIGNYVLVRYSKLVDGHSSTNGRYAVELVNGEVTDVTSADDFANLFY